MKSKAKLTEGPVGALLVKMTIPMTGGLLSIMTFNLVDTIYIARLGTEYLAAISFTFPIVMVGTNLAIGLGIGTSSSLARAIGESNQKRVQVLATSGLLLAIIVSIIFIIIGLLTIEPLFLALGASQEMLPLIKEYMIIWYSGMLFLAIPLVGNFIIRSTGDTFWPGIIMAISSIINILLDPILIFGWFGAPRLEMKGAAMATVIANIFTLFASLGIIYYREKLVAFKVLCFDSVRQAIKTILHVAVPAASTHMVVPIGAAIILRLVSKFGPEAVAAFGAASRIEMIAFIIVLALSSVIGPVIGQNLGAGAKNRILHAMRLDYKFCVYFGLIQALIVAYFGEHFMKLFDHNPLVIHYGVMYLLIIPLGWATHGIIFNASGVFNGSGHPGPAVVISVCRMFVLYIPLAYFLSNLFSIYGVFAAYTISSIIMGIIATYWSFKVIEKA